MSQAGAPFVPLEAAKSERPRSAYFGPSKDLNFLRDQLTIETWLCLGAALQGGLFLLAGRLALLPALALLSYRLFDTIAQANGWKRNQWMDGVIQKKFSAQFPREDGTFSSVPCDNQVVVFLIGARWNHPLGMLAPGVKRIGGYFSSMMESLDKAGQDEFGYLGATNWLNASDRSTASELMVVCYFRDVQGLHKFAHSKMHREGWDWWNKGIQKHRHISIWHETYQVPKGHWESIYINSHVSGINSTTFKVFDKETGTEKWQSPIVDASRGLLKTSAGRMSQSKGTEHDKYDADPYETY